ncbi:hypothetical protein SOVF_192320 [Spinacia oleracea]|nr:hypothetical protein SOVF_192320 [Spinacia oleracea]
MGALALKFRTIDLYVVDEVNVPNLVKTPQPTTTNPSFMAKKATQPKESSLPKNITQPKKPTPLWKSQIKKVQNNPPLAQIPSPVTTKSHPSNIKYNDILPIQSQTKSTNQTHLDDYHTWYDDRPESPIPWKDLIGENEGDLSPDRTNPLYEPESEEYDGSESEPDDDVDEIYIEQEELEEIDDEDLIVEEGDSSDDELKDARENVRGYNAKLFELAQQLQREIAAAWGSGEGKGKGPGEGNGRRGGKGSRGKRRGTNVPQGVGVFIGFDGTPTTNTPVVTKCSMSTPLGSHVSSAN